MSICGTTTLNLPDVGTGAVDAEPRAMSEAEPVFAEPWQAQAFALTMRLHDAGYFA